MQIVELVFNALLIVLVVLIGFKCDRMAKRIIEQEKRYLDLASLTIHILTKVDPTLVSLVMNKTKGGDSLPKQVNELKTEANKYEKGGQR